MAFLSRTIETVWVDDDASRTIQDWLELGGSTGRQLHSHKCGAYSLLSPSLVRTDP